MATLEVLVDKLPGVAPEELARPSGQDDHQFVTKYCLAVAVCT